MARHRNRPGTQAPSRGAAPWPAAAGRSSPPLPAGSLGGWLSHLGAELDRDWFPVWPPDAFALAAALLRRTGAYASLVNGMHSRYARIDDQAPAVGREWRATLGRALTGGDKSQRLREACPPAIRDWWGRFGDLIGTPLMEAGTNPALVSAACALCVASDEACEGMGIRVDESDAFLGMAERLLVRHQGRSFCWRIPHESLAVLPKQHTPQRGCTIRSLTHNLALHTAAEIKAYWAGPFKPASGDLDVLNLLLLPWPTEVSAADFRVAGTRRGGPGRALDDSARYFDYAPTVREPARAVAARVRRALAAAHAHADQVHGVVLPELALDAEQFVAVEQVVVGSRAMLISGIRAPGTRDQNGMPVNMCAIQPVALTGMPEETLRRRHPVWDQMRRVQLKHHRWCLDREQILQYSLGGRLPASRECWERIFIGSRDVHFVTLGSWLTLCVLICEDLARQDPVAEVIRAVGPNLVFALLMDGPQIRQRWPARYASVLAEDPGCSVLSLTCLGMSRRSRPRETDSARPGDRSTTIALWRDAVFGEREIALAEGHDACVLSLVCRTIPERSIDGRVDREHAHFPVFAGAYSFAVPEPRAWPRTVPRDILR